MHCKQLKIGPPAYESSRTDLFRAKFVCGLHEVGADEREGNAVAMLSRKFHALLELMLKHRSVETTQHFTGVS